MGQIRRVVGDLVDIEEYRTWYVALAVFCAWIAVLRRQVPGTVDDAHIRRIEQSCQGICVDQGLGAHHYRSLHQAKTTLTRRLCRPLFSTLETAMPMSSEVLETWVPPQG